MSGAYISRDTLAEWRKDAEKHKTGSDPKRDRILRLIDALEAPCGSCHPCSHWAAETWRRAGGELPHKVTVDEWHERMQVAEAGIDLLRRVHEYWDGRPTEHHGHHIYSDLCDVLQAIEPAPEGGA